MKCEDEAAATEQKPETETEIEEWEDPEERDEKPDVKRRCLGPCAVCEGGTEARYRCPGCGAVYCSVGCFAQHKSKSGCSGKRDKTAFVPLEKLRDTHLMSDYMLLEDTLRRKNAGYRSLSAVSSARHPNSAMNLVRQAQARGTTLILMPQGMTRRKTNSSTFRNKIDTIFWKVEFLIGSCTLTAPQADEKKTPPAMLDSVLSDPCAMHSAAREKTLEHPTPSLLYLLVDCDSPSHAPKYHDLPSDRPLKESLSGKRILEHPQIRVVMPSESANYERVPVQPAPAPAAIQAADVLPATVSAAVVQPPQEVAAKQGEAAAVKPPGIAVDEEELPDELPPGAE